MVTPWSPLFATLNPYEIGEVMSDEERPYLDHSEREVMREQQRWGKIYRSFVKEFNAAERVGARDDMDSARRDMDRALAEESKCTRELKLRRDERAAGRARREEQRHSNRSQPSTSTNRPAPAAAEPIPVDPTGGALARWFGRLSLEPRDVTIRAIDYNWQLQGRNYYAIYTSADRLLSVWLEVLPGTPDATMINNAPHLPANSPREIGRALEAEKKVRRRQA